MGMAWSFITPLLMLTVYTFVFSVIFNARWGQEGQETGRLDFALILFVAMIIHSLFAEIANRAPTLIVSNANYVKKVIFPIEILPVVAAMSALFHAAISTLALIFAQLLLKGALNWTVVFFPLVIAPMLVFALGVAWFISSLGVYVRDLSQIVVVITTVMMFLAPVFYPVSALPDEYRSFIMANPLTFIIEQARSVVIWGALPDFLGLGKYLLIASVMAWLGFAWFQKTRKGFADVL